MLTKHLLYKIINNIYKIYTSHKTHAIQELKDHKICKSIILDLSNPATGQKNQPEKKTFEILIKIFHFPKNKHI